MEKPVCRVCGAKHWGREPHVFEKGSSKFVPVVEEGGGTGKGDSPRKQIKSSSVETAGSSTVAGSTRKEYLRNYMRDYMAKRRAERRKRAKQEPKAS
jgi:hypothetical protein